ncbi:unnamed protein product [Amoebophrya sp. A120]|nr:unnamed protein product [Amoebophrya sp. A120]|eukprot:GSA120T00003916001.1
MAGGATRFAILLLLALYCSSTIAAIDVVEEIQEAVEAAMEQSGHAVSDAMETGGVLDAKELESLNVEENPAWNDFLTNTLPDPLADGQVSTEELHDYQTNVASSYEPSEAAAIVEQVNSPSRAIDEAGVGAEAAGAGDGGKNLIEDAGVTEKQAALAHFVIADQNAAREVEHYNELPLEEKSKIIRTLDTNHDMEFVGAEKDRAAAASSAAIARDENHVSLEQQIQQAYPVKHLSLRASAAKVPSVNAADGLDQWELDKLQRESEDSGMWRDLEDKAEWHNMLASETRRRRMFTNHHNIHHLEHLALDALPRDQTLSPEDLRRLEVEENEDRMDHQLDAIRNLDPGEKEYFNSLRDEKGELSRADLQLVHEYALGGTEGVSPSGGGSGKDAAKALASPNWSFLSTNAWDKMSAAERVKLMLADKDHDGQLSTAEVEATDWYHEYAKEHGGAAAQQTLMESGGRSKILEEVIRDRHPGGWYEFDAVNQIGKPVAGVAVVGGVAAASAPLVSRVVSTVREKKSKKDKEAYQAERAKREEKRKQQDLEERKEEEEVEQKWGEKETKQTEASPVAVPSDISTTTASTTDTSSALLASIPSRRRGGYPAGTFDSDEEDTKWSALLQARILEDEQVGGDEEMTNSMNTNWKKSTDTSKHEQSRGEHENTSTATAKEHQHRYVDKVLDHRALQDESSVAAASVASALQTQPARGESRKLQTEEVVVWSDDEQFLGAESVKASAEDTNGADVSASTKQQQETSGGAEAGAEQETKMMKKITDRGGRNLRGR